MSNTRPSMPSANQCEATLLTPGSDNTSNDQSRPFSSDGSLIALHTHNSAYLWRSPSWKEIHAAEASEKPKVPLP